MRPFRDASVKAKLTLTSVASSGAALLLVGAVAITYDLMTLRSTLVRRMSVQADIVGANCLSALLFSDPQSAEATLAALKAEPHILAAGLYGSDRRLFSRYLGWLETDATGLLPDGLGERQEDPRLRAGRLVLSRAIVFNGGPIGTVVIVSDLREIGAALRRDVVVFASVLLVSLLLALAVSSRLQRRIAQPILHLVETARRVTLEKDYGVRASGDSRDEIGTLVSAFNEMLGEIQQRESALRAAHDRLEQRVAERTAQLQSANKELEAFCYSVSHDLRAPLRHIAGFAQLLGASAGGVGESGKRYVQKITQAATRMGQLIDDLLVFSRIGRSELQTVSVNLGDLLVQVLKEAQPDLKGRPIDWQIGPLPTVRGDPATLRMALANLVSNAVKYTATRERPRIEIGVGQDTDRELVIYVRDNGVGFDMQYASKLFGVFQRLHRADEFEGTGIGLANVRRIIDRHGGRTWAEGESGRGAAFYFSLPKDREAAA